MGSARGAVFPANPYTDPLRDNAVRVSLIVYAMKLNFGKAACWSERHYHGLKVIFYGKGQL
jgi:hypothetical protein